MGSIGGRNDETKDRKNHKRGTRDMSSVLLKAGCFFLIILMGYGLKKIGLLSQTDLPVFSKLVTKITLPAAIIHNFSQATMDISMLVIVLIGFLCSGLYAVIGYGLFAKGTRDQKAFGLVNASGYNIGCFTMPFVQGFLGAPGVACTSLFDTGNAVVCTGGSYAVAMSVAGKSGSGDKHQIRRIVIQLLKSVPFDCYVIMTVLTMAGLRLPLFVNQVAETVGNANTFLSMMMIGLGLELHMTREQTGSVAKILGTRFAVSAVLAVLFYQFLPFSLEIRRTLAILMFGPVSALGVPYTSMLNGDVNLASAVNSASIILGIVSLTAAIIIF